MNRLTVDLVFIFPDSLYYLFFHLNMSSSTVVVVYTPILLAPPSIVSTQRRESFETELQAAIKIVEEKHPISKISATPAREISSPVATRRPRGKPTVSKRSMETRKMIHQKADLAVKRCEFIINRDRCEIGADRLEELEEELARRKQVQKAFREHIKTLPRKNSQQYAVEWSVRERLLQEKFKELNKRYRTRSLR